MDRAQDVTTLARILKSLSQHRGTTIHAGDFEPGLDELHRMKAGTGSNIQYFLRTVFAQLVNEKLCPFTGFPGEACRTNAA